MLYGIKIIIETRYDMSINVDTVLILLSFEAKNNKAE